jgi:hypothetical protein
MDIVTENYSKPEVHVVVRFSQADGMKIVRFITG